MADHGDDGALDDDSLGVVYEGRLGYRERITSAFLARVVIGIPEDRQSAQAGKRIALMRKNGWNGPKPLRVGGRVAKGFERELDPLA